MNQFMVEITLPGYLTQEFIELIPEQRAFIDSVMEKGVITGYMLALDRSKLWVTFRSRTTADVIKILQAFPIAAYIEYTISELAFFNSAASMVPSISLN